MIEYYGMKKLYIIFFLIHFLFSASIDLQTYAQAPGWLWAKKAAGIGVSNFSVGEAIATDASGNIYVGGYFDGPEITFDSYTVYSPGNSNEQLYLVKYDPAGNVLWAKSAVSAYGNTISSLALDASGNIYIIGDFYANTITLGSTTLINAGSSDFFIAKYDPDGNLSWAKSFGSNASDGGMAIAVGALGDIYITGHFFSKSISFGPVTLTKTGINEYNMFVAKFDSDGNAIWATKATGDNDSYASSIAVDASGNAYLSGQFSSPAITFGAYTLTKLFLAGGTVSYDIFLTKFDNTGNVVWAKSAGSTRSSTSNSVSVDNSGNVFLAGNFSSPTITLGSITLSNPVPDYTNIFLAKYDAGGNVTWAIGAGGSFNELTGSVATDKLGNVYLTGYFESSSITFGDHTLTNQYPQSSKLYVTKFDPYGNAQWVKSTVEMGSYGHALTVDNEGYVLITGATGVPALHFDAILLDFAKSDFTSFTAKLSNYSANILHTDVSCYGGKNGTASVIVTGGTAPFTFLWNTTPTRTTDTAMGLPAGSYNLTVTDATGMITFGNVIIDQPEQIQSFTSRQICHGDSLLLKGSYYYASAILYDTLTAKNGCDSILQLSLVVEPEYSTQQTATICEGSLYDFYGTPLISNGKYNHKLFSVHGCDSIITINLTVNPTYLRNNSQAICNGDSYTIGTNIYSSPGNYYDTLKSNSGCDSIILTKLALNPSYSYTDQQTICPGQAYVFHGKAYSLPGLYQEPYKTIHSCDSIFELLLMVAPADTTKQSETICQGGNYSFYGSLLTTAGIYYHTLSSLLGCDSVIKTELSIKQLPVSGIGDDILIPHGNSVQLNASGGISYIWSPPDFLTDPNIADPVATPMYDILYFVTITDTLGCISTDSINIIIGENEIWFPNAFSPDGDNVNDVFRPRAFNLGNYTMFVFNKWGQLLFETDIPGEGWDGNFRGKRCPDDVYVYTARFSFADSAGPKTIRGNVTLIRKN